MPQYSDIYIILYEGHIILVIGGNEARPQNLQWSSCDASWSTGACILSSVVGAPQQKRQQQQHILESRLTCFSHSRTLVVPGISLRVLCSIHRHVAYIICVYMYIPGIYTYPTHL